MTTKAEIPQAVPLEEAVLGAVIIDSAAFGLVSDTLRPESFFLPRHGTIYQAVEKMAKNGHSVDLLTLTEWLKKTGELEDIGGPEYIIDLANRVASAANIEYHARIIAQKHIQREVMSVSTQIGLQAASPEVDAFELLEAAEKYIYEIGNKSTQGQAVKVGKFASEALANLLEVRNSPDGLIGVPSGMTEIDRVTGGWRKSDLIVIAARPGMGKTALTLTIADCAARDFGKNVLFFSLEMSGSQLSTRILSSRTGINGHRLTMGKATDEEMSKVEIEAELMQSIPLTIDDSAGATIPQMRSMARRQKAKSGLDLIIVDYLQLVSSGEKFGNREQEVAAVARGLKGMAKELNVPVIALAQLSRAVEARGGDKRPNLADLRESGQIEQDADMIAFLWRPAYYGIEVNEKGVGYPKGHTELMIRKFRGGPSPIDIPLVFQEETTSFEDPKPEPFSPTPSASVPNDFTIPARANADADIPF